MGKQLKLKTKIIHSFEIESELLDDLDFNMDIAKVDIKKKTQIIEIKRKTSKTTKADASTRLF